jgi:hypothetical protein
MLLTVSVVPGTLGELVADTEIRCIIPVLILGLCMLTASIHNMRPFL